MEELILYFDAGSVEGSGRDAGGRFTFVGTFDSAGRVRMIKQYVGRNQVLYEGSNDGNGAISGECSTDPHMRGAFALTPMRSWADPAEPAEE
jgi:hypothetical protein